MGWEIALIVGYIAIPVILIVIAFNLDEAHAPLKALFLGISLFIVLLLMNSLFGILSENGLAGSNVNLNMETLYKVYMFGILYPVCAYFIIYTIFYFINQIPKKF